MEVSLKSTHLITLALAIATFGCSTQRISTDSAPGVDFGNYKTFTIKASTPPKNQAAAERMEGVLGNAIQAKGLTRLPEGGELYVYPYYQLNKETKAETTGYGFTGWERWGATASGNGTGGVRSGTTTIKEVPVGTFIITLVDAKSNTAVWRGTAKDQISTSATPEEQLLKANETFRKLFEGFPPKK